MLLGAWKSLSKAELQGGRGAPGSVTESILSLWSQRPKAFQEELFSLSATGTVAQEETTVKNDHDVITLISFLC